MASFVVAPVLYWGTQLQKQTTPGVHKIQNFEDTFVDMYIDGNCYYLLFCLLLKLPALFIILFVCNQSLTGKETILSDIQNSLGLESDI